MAEVKKRRPRLKSSKMMAGEACPALREVIGPGLKSGRIVPRSVRVLAPDVITFATRGGAFVSVKRKLDEVKGTMVFVVTHSESVATAKEVVDQLV